MEKPTMLLITAELKDGNSFRMIPASKDCPFSEAIYDTSTKVLAVMSAESKDSLHLVPKISDDGDLVPTKRPRTNGKSYKEQRITLDTFVEYYISVQEEIADFIKRFAVNEKDFEYQKYLDAPPVHPQMQIQEPPGAALDEEKVTEVDVKEEKPKVENKKSDKKTDTK